MSDLLPKEELKQRVTYTPPPPRSYGVWFGLAGVILLIGALGGLYRYGAIYLEQEFGGAQEAADFLQVRARLTDTIAKLPNVSGENLARGFWYTYTDWDGNEHVLYFDADQLARADLSDEEVRILADTIAQSRITPRENVRQLAEEELPSNLQFHNQLYSFGTAGATSLDLEAALATKVAAGDASADDLFRLAYIYELEGKYAERDRLNAENCARFNKRCGHAFSIALSGRVVDGKGDPIEGATIEVVSRPDVTAVQTDENGTYRLPLSAQEMEKLRVRASKRNLSDGYEDVVLLAEGREAHAMPDIALESPITIVTIDPARKSVTGGGNSVRSDGTYVITTPQSVYEIPPDAVVDADGTPHTGPIDVYLYEFSKGNIPESLTQLDTFDEVVGYAGDLMKTFGMPYIQFFTQDGEELHVLKSNPMVLTYRIADMEALRTNADRIYRALSHEDMELLVEASRGNPYAIDRQFLINNQLLHFPGFWVFDRERGMWDSVGVSVLDINGTIRSIFYTVRDDF